MSHRMQLAIFDSLDLVPHLHTPKTHFSPKQTKIVAATGSSRMSNQTETVIILFCTLPVVTTAFLPQFTTLPSRKEKE